MFLKVCKAFFLNNEWKWLIFICSDMSGCILIIVWNRSSNGSNFSLLPSKVIVFELTGRIVSCWAVGRFCMLVKTSASLLIGSCSRAGMVVSCAGIVVSSKGLRSSWDLCTWLLDGIRPVKNSGTSIGDSFFPVTMSQALAFVVPSNGRSRNCSLLEFLLIFLEQFSSGLISGLSDGTFHLFCVKWPDPEYRAVWIWGNIWLSVASLIALWI